MHREILFIDAVRTGQGRIECREDESDLACACCTKIVRVFAVTRLSEPHRLDLARVAVRPRSDIAVQAIAVSNARQKSDIAGGTTPGRTAGFAIATEYRIHLMIGRERLDEFIVGIGAEYYGLDALRRDAELQRRKSICESASRVCADLWEASLQSRVEVRILIDLEPLHIAVGIWDRDHDGFAARTARDREKLLPQRFDVEVVKAKVCRIRRSQDGPIRRDRRTILLILGPYQLLGRGTDH